MARGETMKNKWEKYELLRNISLTITLLIVLGVALFPEVLAFPFQLNPNGSLSEVNLTINGTQVDIVLFNDTIYIIEKNITNYTIFNYNVTNINITNVNTTCLNCTNYYNETIYHNETYFYYGYNRSELDGIFLFSSDFNTYKSGLTYVTKEELDAIEPKETSIWLWLSILGLFLINVCIIGFIVWMTRGGE